MSAGAHHPESGVKERASANAWDVLDEHLGARDERKGGEGAKRGQGSRSRMRRRRINQREKESFAFRQSPLRGSDRLREAETPPSKKREERTPFRERRLDVELTVLASAPGSTDPR